ncbi:MAG: acyltransferase family protein [Polyangiaceae bacterium]|nr:acyltransferase family protein [Polyangiaceae bacterium]
MTTPTLLDRFAATLAGKRVARLIRERFRATLTGAEHVPREGAALLVGNHTLLGVDSIVLTALLQLEVGRAPRFLAERNLFRAPFARALFDAIGAVPGEPEAATRLLTEGELVGVYPGGVDDSFKLARDAYTLRWGERAGFARVAMRARAPIVPMAALGIDELFSVIAHEPWLGRALLGDARYDLPIVASLVPRDVPLRYHALPPVDTAGDPEDPADVARVRQATFDALESVLAPYRAELAAR